MTNTEQARPRTRQGGRGRGAPGSERTADPYRDLDVIDSRAPRANQAVVGTLALVAFLVDWWPLLAILAVQLLIGLRYGRRFCLPCLAYFELIQPRFGEGPTEDSRPPRFANQVGLVFLSLASVAHLAGLETIGWVLGLIVASLALLAFATGLCVGCEMYKLAARIRGVRSGSLESIDRSDVGVGAGEDSIILFSHPLCTECHQAERDLGSRGEHLVVVDVRARPDLARKYGISVVPTVLRLGADDSTAVVSD